MTWFTFAPTSQMAREARPQRCACDRGPRRAPSPRRAKRARSALLFVRLVIPSIPRRFFLVLESRLLEIGLLLSRQFLNVLALTRLGGGRLARAVLQGARGVTSRSRLLARSIGMLRGPGRNRRLAEAPRLDRLPSLQGLAFCLSTDLVKGDLGLPGRSGQ